MGKCYLSSELYAGSFSFTLSERGGKTEFAPERGFADGAIPFRMDEVSGAVTSWLQGRPPPFLKKVTERTESARQGKDETVFFFSRNKYALKKMTVRNSDGRLAGISLFFKKGFAEIEVMDIVYAEN